jgi:hypothetical protein
VLLALLPGYVGAFFLQRLTGRDWRERDWHTAIRYLAVSAVGLALYVISAATFDWPPARHVIPDEYSRVSAENLVTLALPYGGHILGGALAGLLIGLALRHVAPLMGISRRPCSWDTFVADLVQGRWIVMTLKSGDVYAGYIQIADTGVAGAERDLVLREPARYDADAGEYRAVGYRDMFIPAQLVDSIATVANPGEADRLTAIGQPLFRSATRERASIAAAQAESASAGSNRKERRNSASTASKTTRDAATASTHDSAE